MIRNGQHITSKHWNYQLISEFTFPYVNFGQSTVGSLISPDFHCQIQTQNTSRIPSIFPIFQVKNVQTLSSLCLLDLWSVAVACLIQYRQLLEAQAIIPCNFAH